MQVETLEWVMAEFHLVATVSGLGYCAWSLSAILLWIIGILVLKKFKLVLKQQEFWRIKVKEKKTYKLLFSNLTLFYKKVIK